MNEDFFHSDKNIIFYDNSCHFCVKFANFLKKRTSNLYFFSLQSVMAQRIFQKHHLGTPSLDSACLWKARKMYKASDAVLQSFFFAKIYWRFFARIALFFPSFFRDKVYFFIANQRYCFMKK